MFMGHATAMTIVYDFIHIYIVYQYIERIGCRSYRPISR